MEQVEDLHVWSLSSQILVVSVYVPDSTTTIEQRDELVERIHNLLETKFDIIHSTVEVVNRRHTHSLSNSD